MGEKEQGAARESNAPRDVMTGQSSGRSIPENSIEAGDVAGDGTLDEGPLSVLKNKTKSNQSNDRLGREDHPDGAGVVQYNESEMEFRQAGDGDDPAQTAINNSHSNIKNLRSGSGGVDDDGDDQPDSSAGVINTTRSNIKSTS